MALPRIAVIAYFAAPVRAVARLRVGRLIASLAESTVDVHVFRPSPDVWRPAFRLPSDSLRDSPAHLTIHDTPHPAAYLAPSRLRLRWADRVPRVYGILDRLVKLYPDEDACGWTRELRHAFSKYSRGDFDLICVSAGPFTPLLPAMELARSTGARFWVDYRDPFTDNPHIRRTIRRRWANDERRWLGAADLITTVSPSHAALLRTKLDRDEGRVRLLWNYLDVPQATSSLPPCPDSTRVTYAGGFYRGSREIAPVFSLLKRVGEMEPQLAGWTLEYIGSQTDYVIAEARRLGVASHVECTGVVAPHEAISRQRSACAAVCIASTAQQPTAYESGNVSSKFFELVAHRCRTLVIGPREHDLFSVSRQVKGSIYIDPRDEGTAAADLARALLMGIAPACPDPSLTWNAQWLNSLVPALHAIGVSINTGVATVNSSSGYIDHSASSSLHAARQAATLSEASDEAR